MAYVGQTRGGKMLARCHAMGLGEMTQPTEYPPRRVPWALDNGAFKLWKSGRPFDGETFWRVAQAAALYEPPPDFVVCPDVVAGGMESLALSLAWAPRLASIGLRLAIVVQDGMTEDDVEPHLSHFDVVFVGGSLDWKLATMKQWAALARRHGRHVHVGRIGGRRRVLAASGALVDSVDSCVPLFSDGNMDTFERALATPVQLGLV